MLCIGLQETLPPLLLTSSLKILFLVLKALQKVNCVMLIYVHLFCPVFFLCQLLPLSIVHNCKSYHVCSSIDPHHLHTLRVPQNHGFQHRVLQHEYSTFHLSSCFPPIHIYRAEKKIHPIALLCLIVSISVFHLLGSIPCFSNYSLSSSQPPRFFL